MHAAKDGLQLLPMLALGIFALVAIVAAVLYHKGHRP